MEYQPEEEKIYPCHCDELSKSVKRVRDITQLEKRYLETLEPFICIVDTSHNFGIETRWYSGKGKNERRVHRLYPFSNLGQNALVSNNFMEALAFGERLLGDKFPELLEEWEHKCERDQRKKEWLEKEKNKHKESLWEQLKIERALDKNKIENSFYEFLKNKGKDPDLVGEFVFVPLSDYLRFKDIDQEIIEHIDLQELKEKWNIEILSNVLIRIKEEKKKIDKKKLHDMKLKEFRDKVTKLARKKYLARRMRQIYLSGKIKNTLLAKIFEHCERDGHIHNVAVNYHSWFLNLSDKQMFKIAYYILKDERSRWEAWKKQAQKNENLSSDDAHSVPWQIETIRFYLWGISLGFIGFDSNGKLVFVKPVGNYPPDPDTEKKLTEKVDNYISLLRKEVLRKNSL